MTRRGGDKRRAPFDRAAAVWFLALAVAMAVLVVAAALGT